MTVDPLLALAVTIQANPGTYALLLGSGTSRSAGIPSGWDVTLDLVRRVAAAAKEDPGADLQTWYKARFGKRPRYNELIGEVTGSRAERAGLLRGYFEPNDEEREQGLKLPTAGHHAIGRLVAGGYIRLILETNFDTLVEAGIEQSTGIPPTLIATADAIRGATPLVHSGPTVVKLHGDYRDTRIRNTEEELERYDPPLNRYLDRVFDEFGLIIIGWSAEWDGALRAALERRRSRRYGIYWAVRGAPNETQARLINLLSAEILTIKDADGFLSDLADRIQSVADVQRRPPLALDTAVATVKRYIVDPSAHIRLKDLVDAESELALDAIGDDKLAFGGGVITSDRMQPLVDRANSGTEVLRAILATGAYWDPGRQDLWVQTLQRFANPGNQPRSIDDDPLTHQDRFIAGSPHTIWFPRGPLRSSAPCGWLRRLLP